MAKDFKKFTMCGEPQEAEFYPKGTNTSDGTVFIAHSQAHDERIRKEERALIMSRYNALLTAEEFHSELLQLGEQLPLILELLDNTTSFDEWPEHLKKDSYKKLHLQPVIMYRRNDTSEISKQLAEAF